jgi:hypothetical protein
MAVSGEDLYALKIGRECVQQMRSLLPIESKGTETPSIVSALLTICLQHCDSVLLLLESGENVASAEALLRPMVESAFRLLWLAQKKERAEQITTGKMFFPSFSRLIRSTPGAAKQNPVGLQTATTNLHDLAHAGMSQLRKFEEAQNDGNPPQEKLSLRLPIILAMQMSLIASGSFCNITGKQQERDQITAVYLVHICGVLIEVLNAITPIKCPLPAS